MSSASLLAGALVGFSVAVPLGPMGLLCIQRTLSCGMGVGFSTGLGGATANVLCAAAVMAGLDRLLSEVDGDGRVLSAVGGVFLLWCAARALRRRVGGAVRDDGVKLPLPAYASAVAYNLTNPASLVLMVALLSPVAGLSAMAGGERAVLLLGLFAAAALWWLCLTGTVALLRARLGARAVWAVNQVAGVLLTAYGTVALARAAGL